MLLSEFQQTIDSVIPTQYAMHGDAIGLQIEAGKDVSKALVCLEVTDDVIDEAIAIDCNAIVTFHPLIFSPLSRITLSDRVGRLTSKLIKHDVSLVSVHTAYDAFPQGTNAILAEKLDLQTIRSLQPANDDGFGMGLVTRTHTPVMFGAFVERVQNVCGGPVKFVPSRAESISTVAIVAGSGMSFFDDAVASGVDVFVTADVKYHGFHAADNVIGLIDPGHYEMEQFVPAGLTTILSEHFGSHVRFVTSNVDTNPVRYAYPQHIVYSSQPSGTV